MKAFNVKGKTDLKKKKRTDTWGTEHLKWRLSQEIIANGNKSKITRREL